jgi:hypothetical protein
MPGGDGTGPQGLGPMTGRAAGYCAGYQEAGYANPVPRGGFRSYNRQYDAQPVPRIGRRYPMGIARGGIGLGLGLGRGGRGRGRGRW